jgi:hypothetical protein
MRKSLVKMLRSTPISTKLSTFMLGWEDDWQELFQGAGSISTFEYPYKLCDRQTELRCVAYDFVWGSRSNQSEFEAFRRHHTRSRMAIFEIQPTPASTKVLIAFGSEDSADEAIRSLERIVRRIKHAGILVGRDKSKRFIWEAHDETGENNLLMTESVFVD